MEAKEINLTSIRLSDSNVRKDLEAGTEDASLDDLVSSIRERGLLNPVTVVTGPDGYYDLIAGQRRFLACKRIGQTTISAIVRDDLEDADRTIISLVENVHRADLSPIDKARAYQSIYSRYGDFKRVAQEAGVSPSTVRRYLSLLKLAPSIQDGLSTSDGPAGIGTLSKIAETFSAEEQESVLDKIGGFKQQIQGEILNRSGGDLNKIQQFREEALEGAFDTKTCHEGLCFDIPEDWKSQLRAMLAEEIRPDMREFARNARR